MYKISRALLEIECKFFRFIFRMFWKTNNIWTWLIDIRTSIFIRNNRICFYLSLLKDERILRELFLCKWLQKHADMFLYSASSALIDWWLFYINRCEDAAHYAFFTLYVPVDMVCNTLLYYNVSIYHLCIFSM